VRASGHEKILTGRSFPASALLRSSPVILLLAAWQVLVD